MIKKAVYKRQRVHTFHKKLLSTTDEMDHDQLKKKTARNVPKR